MPDQENPNIRFISVRVTQELFRKAEIRAEARQMDISGLVRYLLTEECVKVKLTSEDYAELARRTKERENVLNGRA